MPHPVSQRAKFMNNCLPKCYKSLYGVKYNNLQDLDPVRRRKAPIQHSGTCIKDNIKHWRNIEHEQSQCCSKILHRWLCSCTMYHLICWYRGQTLLSSVNLLENISHMDIEVLKLTSASCFTQRPESWCEGKGALNCLMKLLIGLMNLNKLLTANLNIYFL